MQIHCRGKLVSKASIPNVSVLFLSLREKLSNSLMKKREYLDEQIQQIMNKKGIETDLQNPGRYLLRLLPPS